MTSRSAASASVNAGSQLSRLPRKCCSITSGWSPGVRKRAFANGQPPAAANSVSARLWVVLSLTVMSSTPNRLEDRAGVLRRRLFPHEVPGVDPHEAAPWKPLVEELGGGHPDA